jgi:FkbM family methyltransferase
MSEVEQTGKSLGGIGCRIWHKICRHWPWIRGRDRLMRISVGNPKIRSHIMAQSSWVRTRAGFELKVSEAFDHTSFALRLFRDFEPMTERFILASMKDGEVFLDVGANVGYFGLLVASKFPQSQVIAFEPNPAIAACLQASVLRNAFHGRITVELKALSSQSGSLPFVVEGDNSGHSRLAATSGANVIHVETVVFDEWAKHCPPTARVACMKMDIEGAEVLALRGMVGLLDRDRPTLCVEGYDNQLREFGSSLEELKWLLQGASYREVAPQDGNLYLKHVSPLN